MGASKLLRRLLRVRHLEEEQFRTEFESALGRLHRLQNTLEWTKARCQRGHLLMALSAHSGRAEERFAGWEETMTATRHTGVLREQIRAAELYAEQLRERYLSKRVERLQAETLLKESDARAIAEESRREQQLLDDWHQSKRARDQRELTNSGSSDGNPRDAS